MYSCDTNILLYALDSSCREHPKAYEYLQKMQTNEEFVICDLVLTELFTLLRNPKVLKSPYSGTEAKEICLQLRSNPKWQILEYTLGSMKTVWNAVHLLNTPLQIYDMRLGIVLKQHGVRNFATRNVKDFKKVGFEKVVNPVD